jgi:hypothetical protein
MIAKTRRDFIRHFKAEYLSALKQQEAAWQERTNPTIDYPYRREYWNNLIDSLVRDNQLPKQAIDWVAPW